jgi:hypothetical protein
MTEIRNQLTEDKPSPNEIRIRDYLSIGRFGKAEVEESAAKLLTFFQERGVGWARFTITDLFNFYTAKGWNPNTMFFGLLGPWYDDGMLYMDYQVSRPYITIDPGGWLNVTTSFVEVCMRP